jgi:NIMA (never in mitosis gene a)-related kinase
MTSAGGTLSDFTIIKKLGDGAYSSVFKVRRHDDNDIYALKKVKMLNLSDKEKENALNEVRILASIDHPNVIGYKDAFIDEASSALCLVMEYADNGDVFQKICNYQKRETYIKEKKIWYVFIQIVRGLKAFHSRRILHRDMKSANIFLFKDMQAKLGDLNVSKIVKKGLSYTQTGTPYYASPEVWRDMPYDSKSDIWSLGCVLYEMCALVPPFRADDMQGLYKKVIKGKYPRIPVHFSQEMATVIKFMLQLSPSYRPSCDQILALPIVESLSKKFFPDHISPEEAEESK